MDREGEMEREGGEGRGGEGRGRREGQLGSLQSFANVAESEQLSKAIVSPSVIHITTGFENHHHTCTYMYTVGS